MSIYKKTESQTETATWAGDSPGIQTDLLRNGPITRIYATARVTPSATFSGANQPDALFKIIQNLTISAGGQTYFTLPADDGALGGALLHYLNVWDGFGPGHPSGRITAPKLTYTPITFVFHAGSRPKLPNGQDNPFDLSGFIPASKLGRLTAVWVTSGNDVMDDTVTITSAVMEYTMEQVLAGSEAELRMEMAAQGVMAAMQPLWAAERYAPTATATAYSDKRNIPVGAWVKRIIGLVQDATADRTLRASDEVTQFSIDLPREGRYLVQASLNHQLAKSKLATLQFADDGADVGGAAADGFFVADLRSHTTYENPMGKDYGIDTRRYGRGDLLLGLTLATNAAGDDLLMVTEQMQEIAGPLL